MTAQAMPSSDATWFQIAQDYFPKLTAEFLAEPARFRRLETFLAVLPTDEDRLLYLQLAQASKAQPDDPVFQNSVAVLCMAYRIMGSSLKQEMGVVFDAAAASGDLINGLKKVVGSVKSALERVDAKLKSQQTEVDTLIAGVSAQVDLIPSRIAESIKAAGKQVQDAALSGVQAQIDSQVTDKIDLKSGELIEQIKNASELFRQLGPHVATMAETFQTVTEAKPIVVAGKAIERKSLFVGLVCSVVFLILGMLFGSTVIQRPATVTLTPAAVQLLEQAQSINKAWPFLDDDTKRKITEAIRSHA